MFFNAHVLCSILIEYDGLEKINQKIKLYNFVLI